MSARSPKLVSEDLLGVSGCMSGVAGGLFIGAGNALAAIVALAFSASMLVEWVRAAP